MGTVQRSHSKLRQVSFSETPYEQRCAAGASSGQGTKALVQGYGGLSELAALELETHSSSPKPEHLHMSQAANDYQAQPRTPLYQNL